MKNLSLLMKNHCLLMKNLSLLMRSHHHLLIFPQQGRGQEGNRNQDDQHQKASAEGQRYLWTKALFHHLEVAVEMDVAEEVEMEMA